MVVELRYSPDVVLVAEEKPTEGIPVPGEVTVISVVAFNT